MFDNELQYLTILDNMGKYQIISNNPTIPDNIRKNWTLFYKVEHGDTGQYRTILDNIGKYWTISVNIVQYLSLSISI